MTLQCHPEEEEIAPLCTLDTVGTRLSQHPRDSPRHTESTLAKAWAKFTRDYRWSIFLFWFAIVWPLGVYSGPKFMRATTMGLKPPVDSLSYEARNVYKETYAVSEWESERPLIALLSQINNNTSANTMVDGTSDLYKSSRDFVFNMERSLETLVDDFRQNIEREGNLKDVKSRACKYCDDLPAIYTSVQSYYSLEREGLSTLAKSASATSDGRNIAVVIQFSVPPQYKDTFIRTVVTYGESNVPPGVHISFTGVDIFEQDALNGIWDDLSFMHTYVGPIAMLVLAFVLGNLPLMIVPVLAIITSIFASTVVMYVVAQVASVAQFTAAVVVAVTTAFSIDYSLFLLTRCSEDIALGMKKNEAIVSMVEHAGHTIFVSSMTLSGCCLMVLLFPVDSVATIGLGATVAIANSFAVSISLTPALLYTPLGSWCLKPNRVFSMICCNDVGNPGRTKTMQQEKTQGGAYDNCCKNEKNSMDLENDGSLIVYEEETYFMRNSLWFRMGKILLHPWKGSLILLAVVAIFAPVASFVPDIFAILDPALMMPWNSPGIQAFHVLGEHFSYGKLAPYRIIFDGRWNLAEIDSKETFEVMQGVLGNLTGGDFPASPSPSSYNGIANMGGMEIPFPVYEAAIQCGVNCSSEALKTIAFMSENEFNSPSHTTTSVFATLEVNPFSPAGVAWIVDARRRIESLADAGMLQNINVVIDGELGVLYDAVDSVYCMFPTVIGATLVAVYLLMGIFFQSAMVPLLSILSITLTQAFVYGSMVLVYQRGILDFLGIRSLSSAGGVFWIVPVVCFTIILGLGLDYDIFLVTRILEFRDEGYTHKSSILKGMYKTRSIISAAGIIMAIALGGLLSSATTMANQASFLLTSAVLMDTFVIRTIVAPILLGFAGDLAWWPRKLPTATKDVTNL